MELKPCPFCGCTYIRKGEQKRTINTERNGVKTANTVSERYKVSCSGCGCGTPWLFYPEDAEAAWNQRDTDAGD